MTIKARLKEYNQVNVDKYISYLKSSTEYWIKSVTEDDFVRMFKEVDSTGLTIDGKEITLTYLGKKLGVSLNYQAYKNLVLLKYPESTFDISLVKKDDTFSFKKENGKVYSTHVIQAFTDSEVIGGYCIIKNNNGEFLELMSIKELKEVRATAKTQAIWSKWTNEMYIKTIIKRACKRHFKDITVKLDTLDNLNYDVSNNQISIKEEDNLDLDIVEKIHDCKTLEELRELYKDKNKSNNPKQFEASALKRSKELKEVKNEVQG